MIDSGKTANPYFARIALARMINSLSGGAVIAPWEVDQLDETWLDAFRVQVIEGPSYAKQQKALLDAKEAWLSKHPTYQRTKQRH